MANENFKISIEGVKELQAKLIHISDRQVEAQFERTMHRATDKIRDEARAVVPVAFGGLRKSIQSEVIDPFHGRVYVSAPYGEAVEKGSRPHFPPVGPNSPLTQWAKQKNIPVYAVAKTIAKRGTRKQPYIAPTFKKLKKEVTKMFQDAIKYLISKD